MRKIKYQWQQEIVDRLNKMSNSELLEEALCCAQGDDYDGCFTKRGQWEFNYIHSLLTERLGDWLNEKN